MGLIKKNGLPNITVNNSSAVTFYTSSLTWTTPNKALSAVTRIPFSFIPQVTGDLTLSVYMYGNNTPILDIYINGVLNKNITGTSTGTTYTRQMTVNKGDTIELYVHCNASNPSESSFYLQNIKFLGALVVPNIIKEGA